MQQYKASGLLWTNISECYWLVKSTGAFLGLGYFFPIKYCAVGLYTHSRLNQ